MSGWTEQHAIKAQQRAETGVKDRREDLEWMARWYETPRGAARRLGISVQSLERWCMRHDPDVWMHLQENSRRRQGIAS